MTRFFSMLLILGLLALPAASWAETRRAGSVERANIRNIFNLIDQVSLKQNDNKARQSAQGILEMKSQMYQASRMPTPGKPASLPPSPLRHSF